MRITFDLPQIPFPDTYNFSKDLNDIIYIEAQEAHSSLKRLREDYNREENNLKEKVATRERMLKIEAFEKVIMKMPIVKSQYQEYKKILGENNK